MNKFFMFFICVLFGHTSVFSQGASFYGDELVSRVYFGTPPYGADDIMSPPVGNYSSPCAVYSNYMIVNSTIGDGNTAGFVYTMSVSKDSTYQFEIEGGTCNSDEIIGTRAARVYIDFNGNSDFSDAGELVFTSAQSSSMYPVFSGSVTIPSDAVEGEIAMRVVYARVGGVDGAGSLWDFDFIDWSTWGYFHGETEDYSLVIAAYIDTVEAINTSCSNTNDGQIIITPASLASPDIEYSINGLAGPWLTDVLYQNLAPGNYSVFARDPILAPNYAYEQFDVTISPASAVTIDAQITSDYNGEVISCSGVSDGEVSVVATGGEGVSYSYEYFSDIEPLSVPSANIVTGLNADNYSFYAIDDLGCFSDTVQLTLTDPAPISIDNVETTSEVSCTDECDAVLTIITSGGTAPFNYEVDGVDYGNTNVVDNICSGSPSVTVSDANDCSLSLNTFLANPTPVNLSLTSLLNYSGFDVSCADSTNGAVSFIASGGTPSYEFSIDGGLTFPYSATEGDSVYGLPAGNYTLIARDTNLCLSTAEGINLQSPQPLSQDPVLVSSPISCNGAADGEITIQVVGGAGGYAYSIDNGTTYQASPVFANLSASTLNISIEDINGCSFQENYDLNEPTVLSLTAISVVSDYNGSQLSCPSSSDATIEIEANGGTGAYSYSLPPNPILINLPANNQVTGFSAGTQSFSLYDVNGCVSNSLNFDVIPPNEVLITNITIDSVSCFGLADGEVTIEGTGGTGNYSYFVDAVYQSTNQAPYTISGLAENNYGVLITDANGCISSVTNVFVPQPATIVSNLSISNLGCSGDVNGSASANPSGGSPNFTYLWSNGSTQSSATQLLAGNYSVTITDANGCQLNESFEVTQPTITLNVTPINCNIPNSGEIQAVLNNSNPSSNFSVLWNDANAQTTLTAVSLAPGDYTVTMTDQFGCVLSASESLEQPDSIFAFVEHTHICEENPVASALVLTSGGQVPYSYLWTNNETTELVQITDPGSYSVVVTDFGGCEREVSFTIDPIIPLQIDYLIQEPSCADNNDASAEAVVSGGYPPYTFMWDNFTENPINDNIQSGAYSLVVTDANGCISETDALVPEGVGTCINAYSAFSPNGDQNNDYWHIDNIELYPDGLVEVFNRWGDRVYSTKAYINAWDGAWQGMYNNEPLPSATYYYVITLNNGEEPTVGTVTIVR
ncbi:MAG: gliding motility-associated C-terminal domain-containing protein [Flavobacteriales bacterium]|nr:gliding motility-associated C-terminal domain-containing protein [Flavobacteriales bacterium]MBL6873441.1 gliding motility-associated C-terminal domain-containing protein [Flavobacteriales bacterium]